MTPATAAARYREVRFRVEQTRVRTRTIIVATTLLELPECPKDNLAALHRARWNQQMDSRSIKTTMQMDVVRGRIPDLVRKEIWTHLLPYNLT